MYLYMTYIQHTAFKMYFHNLYNIINISIQLQYCRIDDFGKIVLKKEHNYFYQIMGQLRVTGRNCCYLVIHTNQWTDIQIIHFDNAFWESTMFNKLKM